MDDNNPLGSVAAFHFNQQYQQQRLGRAFKSDSPSEPGQSDPKLQTTCREMESLFLTYLLKEMRATIPKSDFINGGKAEEIYTSMLDSEMARELSSKGGIGLLSILLDQLGRRQESFKK